MIASITGHPLVGVDPMPFFTRKYQDTTFPNIIKDKYEPTRDKKGFSIASVMIQLFDS